MNKYGICELSVAPVRAEANDRSEIVTQLLFGELVEILSSNESWSKVRLLYDGYCGWICNKQFLPLDNEGALNPQNTASQTLTNHITSIINIKDKTYSRLLPGSSIPTTIENNSFSIQDRIFSFSEKPSLASNSLSNNAREEILDYANMYINAPYLWGGRTPYGIDCSGFSQIVYKLVSIKLLRDASQQVSQGNERQLINALPGDLAFFINKNDLVHHVGIVMNNENIIHASGKVRIDQLDSNGIYNTEKREYTHKLHTIRSFI